MQYVFFCVWFFAFEMYMFGASLDVLLLSGIPLYEYATICLSVHLWEHFLFGSYYGQSYLNVHIQVFMWPVVFVSLKEIPRSENDGSYMIGLF